MRLEWETTDGVPLLRAHGTSAEIAFTSRQGGVSGGSFASLNLGFATADDSGRVAENRRRALAAAGADAARAVSLRQRHGTVVVDAGAVAGGYLDACVRWPEGDALVTGEPGLPVIAHGADCLTAALVAADGSRLAVVHAGWRGLAAGVLEAAAGRLGPGFAAFVGPGAGACCYEVGDDVAEPLRERFGDDVVVGRPRRSRDGRAARARRRGSKGGRRRRACARSATRIASTPTGATEPAAGGRP